ncbi:tandem-95 repeat protein, partial [Psychrobacter sp. TB55-MNA-CIBAN-0194]|uniref:tandem-95 repeat protein n=1 Tax=Psychrobacter sp. TB55-MNA-CIBAN-0194 TaxID=3140445 RepID=UPI00332929F0
ATVDVNGSGTQVALVLGTATAIEDSTGAPIGDLTLNADGSYSFDPAPDFNGTVPTVNYTVTDPEGNTDSTTLDITVDPVNDVVANPETESTDEDVTLTGTVITNDTDEDGDTLTVASATVDVNGSGTQVALVLGTATAIEDSTGAPIGDLTLNADGSYSFDPAPDFNGTVPTVNYTVTDPEGNTDSTTLDITVDPVNDAPVANPEVESTAEDVTLTDNVLPNDTDVDGDTLTVDSATVDVNGSGTQVALVLGTATAIEDSTGAPIGDLTLNADGSYSFDPAPDFNGTVPTVSYVVADPDGNTDSTTLDITVTPVADVPVAADDIGFGPLNQPVAVDVVGNDFDAENDIDPTSVVITQSPAGGTIATDGKSVTVVGEGEWVVDPTTGVITFTPEIGFTADPTPISYTVDDSTGLTSNEATVIVDYPPTSPVTTDDSEIGVSGQQVIIDVLNNDFDFDGDILPTTVIITQSPAGGTIAVDGKSVIVAGEGTWSVDGTTGDITFTPENGFTGDPTPISYTVSDSTGLTSNESIITIDYPQTVPVAVDDNETGVSGAAV